ncbi:hypothetical protein NTE28_003579 [Vibrio harveyi]|nr:hypothetical protein [Vibrio harveyi]
MKTQTEESQTSINTNQKLVETRPGLMILKKKWSRSNYIINKKYEDGVCMSSFNISKFSKDIVKRIHVGVFQNTDVDLDTGEVKENWNIKIDFTLFNDKYHDRFLTHVIENAFPYDKDRVKYRNKKLRNALKKIDGAKEPLDVPLIEQRKNIKDDLLYIEETKKSFDEMVFDKTGKKRLSKELQERFGYFPCVKTVFAKGSFKRTNSVPFMKAWVDMPNGKFGGGELTLMIGMEFFVIPVQALPEPAICDTNSTDSNKRNYLVSVGYHHRDKADEKIGSGWSGYNS